MSFGGQEEQWSRFSMSLDGQTLVLAVMRLSQPKWGINYLRRQ
jgi:hypothetical protein